METLTDRLLHLDQTTDCLAPCRQKCPAQINVPVFVGHLIRRERENALSTIKMRNPFPLTVGRTCPHPCENICRRNIADEGVAIGHLQRFLGEWERRSVKLPLLLRRRWARWMRSVTSRKRLRPAALSPPEHD